MNRRRRNMAAFASALVCTLSWSLGASADDTPVLPPPRKRTSVLELNLGWQTLKLSTKNAQGAASAFSLLGYTAEGAFCPAISGCVVAAAASNLNASSGGRLLAGVSLGAQVFLLGRADPPPEPDADTLGTRPPRLLAIWRVALAGSFCQKDFDFRSLYVSDNSQVYIGASPDLEGAFWCAQGSLVLDYLFRSGHRVGLGVGLFRSLKASQPGLNVQGVTTELRYQLLRF